MLSKVAERIYWAARYLERIESTARLISIYDKLLFDLPRSVDLSWYNLIEINSLQESFCERYSVKDERNVMKFLLGDESNPSSIVCSLKAVRENVRTTRDVIPADVWYAINSLNLYVKEHLMQGVNRSKRYEFLAEVIERCQQILGILHSDMPHDDAWEFLRMGWNLERADMTSRNLDAAVAAIMEMDDVDDAVNSHQIIWLNLLRSLNADQGYRRCTRNAVRSDGVIDYLVTNADFPRAIAYCLKALQLSCTRLPNSGLVAEGIQTIEEECLNAFDPKLSGQPLRDYLNDVQIRIINMHQTIRETWFPAWD